MFFISATGSKIDESFRSSGYTIDLLLKSLLCIKSFWYRRGTILNQLFICGAQSFMVIVIVGIFMGMILALQTGLTLKDYHLEQFIGVVILVSMCKEVGPFMTAFILAGRVGSAMAAELGTMKVSEEIDALEVMSINPLDFLVMPRILALSIIAPVLTVFVNFLGVLGGSVVSHYQLDLHISIYFFETFNYIQRQNPVLLFGGLFKGMVFGIIIAAVSCANGLRAVNGAEGVGNAARKSVVDAFLLILVFNYFMSSIIEKIMGGIHY